MTVTSYSHTYGETEESQKNWTENIFKKNKGLAFIYCTTNRPLNSGWLIFSLAKIEKHCHWLFELAWMLGSYLSVNSILHYPSFSYLGHNDSRSQVKLLHDASVKLLDIVYLKYEEIYSKLCMAATGETCINDRQKLSVLANDLMLLAVSVIGAASFIVNQGTSDMVSCSINYC